MWRDDATRSQFSIPRATRKSLAFRDSTLSRPRTFILLSLSFPSLSRWVLRSIRSNADLCHEIPLCCPKLTRDRDESSINELIRRREKRADRRANRAIVLSVAVYVT